MRQAISAGVRLEIQNASKIAARGGRIAAQTTPEWWDAEQHVDTTGQTATLAVEESLVLAIQYAGAGQTNNTRL